MISRELVATGDVPAAGPLILDLGAAVAPQTTKIDNTTIPKEARVELAISSLF